MQHYNYIFELLLFCSFAAIIFTKILPKSEYFGFIYKYKSKLIKENTFTDKITECTLCFSVHLFLILSAFVYGNLVSFIFLSLMYFIYFLIDVFVGIDKVIPLTSIVFLMVIAFTTQSLYLILPYLILQIFITETTKHVYDRIEKRN